MRIEFAAIGDGVNVEVYLIDRRGIGEPPAEAVIDRFCTRQHKLQLGVRPNKPEYMSCEKFFAYLEEVLLPPVIGGSYGHLHPYWEERKTRRRERESKK